MTFALYGGMLGTNSFGCPNPDGAIPISLSILWTRAGFRETLGYLLIAAALANQYLFQQPSFFKMQIERVRSWKEFSPTLDAMIGLCTARFLIAWGAVVEMMPK